MSPRTVLFLALIAVGLGVVSVRAEAPRPPAPPSVVEPLPFDHAAHRRDLERLGVSCVDCHAFGGPAGPSPEAPIPVAGAVCHGCHRAERAAVSRAPSACAACHPVRAELLPRTHGPDWERAHAAPARAPRSDCADCHERSVCIDCHASRGALARSPHPPAFRSVHGLEARLDPASCDGCHTADSCVSCHTQGGVPW